jgi:hypothetical protein
MGRALVHLHEAAYSTTDEKSPVPNWHSIMRCENGEEVKIGEILVSFNIISSDQEFYES